METTRILRIPVYDIEKAITMYYTKPEMTNDDIRELFGDVCRKKIAYLKNIANEKRIEMSKPLFDARRVNTESAFEAWGINIEEIERKYLRFKKLGLVKGVTQT